MKKLTGNEIRMTWLKFFESKGHKIEKGASLIPYKDPTLLWINSGVAALKKYFDGSEVPPSRRITNVQKSIRTNDIENVGFTARHHTLFEMLGNFSIGDYFRKEVIEWAFEILTSPDYFAMPQDKLYFTYLPTDMDTYQNWIKQGVKPDHLIPLTGNFWQIGEGPCGPNTEVFFDRGEKYDPNHIGIDLLAKDMENDRYIEIWGIVFSQYNAVEGVERENYKELPSKNIDTGAGLERIACVLQETETNFETDLFMPIIKEVEHIAKKPYEAPYLMSYRVIADHIRAMSFAVLDGQAFSNEGRGYVIRRLLRRAVRFGQKIGIETSFMYKLVPVVASIMKDFYPEFNNEANLNKVIKAIKDEEEKFLLTLKSGEELLDKLIKGKTSLSGQDAFKLYDTFGFPIDLTIEICAESGVNVDKAQFEIEMKNQKERARASRKELQSMKKQSKDLLDFKEESIFSYANEDVKNAKVIGLFKDGNKVDELTDEGDIIFDKTTFYAEMGGQVADIGYIENKNCYAEVVDVQRAPNKQHLHHIEIKNGSIKVNDTLDLILNKNNRELIMRNHTATHLLQAALDKVLGDHVNQQGSFVSNEYLRFDFNHNEKITREQLIEIENIVNNNIVNNHHVEIKELPIEEAKKLGAKALFSEKYGDVVRVVIVNDDISKEFCGGTHVSDTREIGIFKIESEESVASGVRRIQARTSIGAINLIKEEENKLEAIRNEINASSVSEILARLTALNKSIDELKKENMSLSSKVASQLSNSIKDEFVVYNGYNVLIKYINDAKKEDLLKLSDSMKSQIKDYVIVLIGGNDGAMPVVVSLGELPRKDGLKAGVLVKEIASVLGGGGGGNPETAFGQGRLINKVNDAILKAKELIK